MGHKPLIFVLKVERLVYIRTRLCFKSKIRIK